MKQTIRAFSLGLLTAAIIIGVTYWIESPAANSSTSATSTEDSIEAIQKEGYFVYQENKNLEIEKLEGQLTNLQTQQDNQESDETQQQEVITTNVSIESGMTLQEIADVLVDNGIINDGEAFITYVEDNDLSTSIQIGEFTLSNQMKISDIAKLITN
ncbi:hypothetical protein MUN88_15435 [Gracilibacillus caseinilyticus]|uniref:YceG-like family protein n=1 Tax=Gracilibacillus caseinilyticus TaxID=2932256 RepID=A0ABY4ETP9_9BACI|nr:hypothetical protein [Gracilibacillus caseinilyticus]UOQ47446.1 hypothetical protein MUN88_15435 [Gracilibacillus caseinilyticus]